MLARNKPGLEQTGAVALPPPSPSHPSGDLEVFLYLGVPRLDSSLGAIAVESSMGKGAVPVKEEKARLGLVFSESENQRDFWKRT